MRILGFAHLFLVNSWYSIFTDQLRILLTSGLYDACEEISISAIGSQAERHLLEMYFINSNYPKLKFKYHSERAEDFEFPALRLIEADKSDYVGFYFHTKAVTRPHETVISHWRAMLNEEILNRWQRHYENICNGYDVSSVNYKASPNHFSGNFWWFNRKYINRCHPVDSMNLTWRYHAEQWICTGNGKFWYPEFKEPGDNIFKIEYKR